jgi:RimJ/RimL family protein N-acetyltransferase
MLHIKYKNRSALVELFAAHPRQRVIIDAVLEKGYGQTIADSESTPELALLTLADVFAVPAGNPAHPQARNLIQGLSPALIVPESEAWRELVLQVHGSRINTQPRVELAPEKLQLDHLRQLAQRVPEGYRIQRIDLELAPRAMGHLAYASAAEFIEKGIGFCALWNGDPVCRIRSYIDSNKGIEIAIITDPEHRAKGLATTTAAALLIHCLEHDIHPYWNAVNSTSVRLAERLGYVQNGDFELLVLEK